MWRTARGQDLLFCVESWQRDWSTRLLFLSSVLLGFLALLFFSMRGLSSRKRLSLLLLPLRAGVVCVSPFSRAG